MKNINLNLNIGDGLSFNSDNELMLNVETSEYVKRNNNGVFFYPLNGKDGQSGQSVEDNYTIIKNSAGRIQTNRNVVEYIFSMCGYQVIDSRRVSVDTYSVDKSKIKTPDEILGEINYCIDKDGATSHSASFILQTGNLLQLRTTVRPAKWPKWTYAMDSLNRDQTGRTLVLFYIKNATYSSTNAYYCKNLTLVCLWSDVSEYVKGQEYVINSKNDY